jgi:hypothetical protein
MKDAQYYVSPHWSRSDMGGGHNVNDDMRKKLEFPLSSSMPMVVIGQVQEWISSWAGHERITTSFFMRIGHRIYSLRHGFIQGISEFPTLPH